MASTTTLPAAKPIPAKVSSSSSSSSSSSTVSSKGTTYVLTFAALFALLSAIAVVVLFLAGFGNTPWLLAILVGIYILSGVCNVVAQLATCSSVSAGSSFTNALYPFGFSAVALALSYFILFFRVPVISAVLKTIEMFTGEPVKGTINTIEKDMPILKGAGISFYIFWSVLLGQIIGGTSSLVC
jgi:hypothetical protein